MPRRACRSLFRLIVDYLPQHPPHAGRQVKPFAADRKIRQPPMQRLIAPTGAARGSANPWVTRCNQRLSGARWRRALSVALRGAAQRRSIVGQHADGPRIAVAAQRHVLVKTLKRVKVTLLIERLLFQLRQHQRKKRPIRNEQVPGRECAMELVIVVQCDSELLQVVRAPRPAGRFSGLEDVPFARRWSWQTPLQRLSSTVLPHK